MRLFLFFFIVLAAGADDSAAVAKMIADAVRPLPESLRDGATVVLDRAPGKREVLRQGKNSLMCRARAAGPGYMARCYHRELDAFLTRLEEVTNSSTSDDQIIQRMEADIKAGKVKVFAGATEYFLGGPDTDRALSIMSVYMPGATSESTGLSSAPDNYRPWLMYAGSGIAHIMIPGK